MEDEYVIVNMPDGTRVKIPSSVMDDQPPPEAPAATEKPLPQKLGEGMLEAGRVVKQSVVGGVLSPIELARHGGTWVDKTFPNLPGSNVNVVTLPKPIREGYDTLINSNNPETRVGKALGNIGETVVGTLTGPSGAIDHLNKLRKGTETAADTASAIKRIALIGAGTGVGGEAAAQVSDDPITRVVGAVLGGGVAATAASMRPNARGMVREAVKPVSAADYRAANRMKATFDDAGVPNIGSQFLGQNSSLDDLVQVASQNPKTRASLLQATEKVSPRSKHALDIWIKDNLPSGALGTREAINDVQEVASGAVVIAKKNRTALWKSTYDDSLGKLRAIAKSKFDEASSGLTEAQKHVASAQIELQLRKEAERQASNAMLTMGTGAKEQVKSRAAEYAAKRATAKAEATFGQAAEQAKNAKIRATATSRGVKTVGRVPEHAVAKEYSRLTRLINSRPDIEERDMLIMLRDKLRLPNTGEFVVDGEQLNDVLQDVSRKLEPAVRSSNGITSGAAKYTGSQIQEMRTRFGEAFIPIKDANTAFKEATNTIVDPMKKGLTGQLANMGGGFKLDKSASKETAIKIVFPKGEAHPRELEQLGKDIGPDAFGNLFREHLASEMNNAVTLSRASSTAQQPFDFVKAVAGTPAQRANLHASLKVIGGGDPKSTRQLTRSFYKLLEAFDSTKNLKVGDSVDKAALGFKAGSNVAGAISAPQSTIRRFTWEHASEKTYRDIVDIVTSPDALKKIQQIGQSEDPRLMRAYARSILVTLQVDGNEADKGDKPEN